MIGPFLVVRRRGADVIRDESALPDVVRHRFRERRQHSSMWWACNGAVLAICAFYPLTLIADGNLQNEWTQPSTIMAVVTMIFAGGQMYQARTEDRRRIQKLEDTTARKDTVDALSESLREVNQKLDRLIEREH